MQSLPAELAIEMSSTSPHGDKVDGKLAESDRSAFRDRSDDAKELGVYAVGDEIVQRPSEIQNELGGDSKQLSSQAEYDPPDPSSPLDNQVACLPV